MSKGNSGLFHGTIGDDFPNVLDSDIIAKRTAKFDLKEHPRKIKTLSLKQKRMIKEKIKNRTASMKEYKMLKSDERFAKRRKKGVAEFWKQEKKRIKKGEKTTREWNDKQKHAILNNKRPKFNHRSLSGHHTFSASKYPHLADKGEVIFPVTFDEHLYGWHGGNFKNSSPGKPIRYSKKHNFRRKK